MLTARYIADETAAPRVAPLASARPGATSAPPTEPTANSMDPPATHAVTNSAAGNAAPIPHASTALGLNPFQNQKEPPGLFDASSTSRLVSTTRFLRMK